jgi:hypothetical protein
LYLVGGSARSGKSALGLTLLRERGVPWLSTDIVRTVLRDADPRIEEADTRPPDLERLATVMRPFIEHTIGVCLAVSPIYLIEGVEILPADVAEYATRFGETRACFLGNTRISAGDLRDYHGDNPWHEDLSDADLEHVATRIRDSSQRLAAKCDQHGSVFIDMGLVGFQPGLREGMRVLLGDRR